MLLGHAPWIPAEHSQLTSQPRFERPPEAAKAASKGCRRPPRPPRRPPEAARPPTKAAKGRQAAKAARPPTKAAKGRQRGRQKAARGRQQAAIGVTKSPPHPSHP